MSVVVLKFRLPRLTNDYNEQSAQIKKQQIVCYDKVEPLKLNREAIHGHPLRLNRRVQRFLGQELQLKFIEISPRNDNGKLWGKECLSTFRICSFTVLILKSVRSENDVYMCTNVRFLSAFLLYHETSGLSSRLFPTFFPRVFTIINGGGNGRKRRKREAKTTFYEFFRKLRKILKLNYLHFRYNLKRIAISSSLPLDFFLRLW